MNVNDFQAICYYIILVYLTNKCFRHLLVRSIKLELEEICPQFYCIFMCGLCFDQVLFLSES